MTSSRIDLHEFAAIVIEEVVLSTILTQQYMIFKDLFMQKHICVPFNYFHETMNFIENILIIDFKFWIEQIFYWYFCSVGSLVL